MSPPARSAHSASCSTAAARKVSPAASSTDLPSSFERCQAILPIVVVLPVPFTPDHQDHGGLVAQIDPVVARARRLGEQLLQPAGELLAGRELARRRPRSRAARRSSPWWRRPRPRRSASPRAAPTSRRRASGRRWPGAPRPAPGASSTCCRAAGGRTRCASRGRPRPRRAAAEAVVGDEQLAPGACHGGGGYGGRSWPPSARPLLPRPRRPAPRRCAPGRACGRPPSTRRCRPCSRRRGSRRRPSCASGG